MVTLIFDLLITLLITEFLIIRTVLINSVNTRPTFAMSILIRERYIFLRFCLLLYVIFC